MQVCRQPCYMGHHLFDTGFPPYKSGMSAIFPAKHQERGPDNRRHVSFFFQEIPWANMTHAVCGHIRQESFPGLPGRPSIPTRACAFQDGHTAASCFLPADIPENAMPHPLVEFFVSFCGKCLWFVMFRWFLLTVFTCSRQVCKRYPFMV